MYCSHNDKNDFYFITLVIQTPAEKVFGPQKYTSTKKKPNLRRYDLMSRVRTPEIPQGLLRSFPPKGSCIKHRTLDLHPHPKRTRHYNFARKKICFFCCKSRGLLWNKNGGRSKFSTVHQDFLDWKIWPLFFIMRNLKWRSWRIFVGGMEKTRNWHDSGSNNKLLQF